MALSTLSYIYKYIKANIPNELLTLAFNPGFHNTSLEARIFDEVINGILLDDVNLVGGKRRDIVLNPDWIVNIKDDTNFLVLGTVTQGSFYMIPPQARDFQNISAVLGANRGGIGSLPAGYTNLETGPGGANNLITAASAMLSSRVDDYPLPLPNVELVGTNMVRVDQVASFSGLGLSVLLEYDAEFMNATQSMILALRELALCAVQRYIGVQLQVKIDETAVVSGMEIGVISKLIDEYLGKIEQYNEHLRKLKGAMLMDPKRLDAIVYAAL
jgi:hypothetical protein